MYSVVLMMALTTGTDSVDFGHRNRGGCHGGGYSGCSGGYGGCHGGHGRHGCSGGGYGGCSGAYGGYGGYGGCSGAYGGCYGGGGMVMPGPMGAPGMQPEPLQAVPKKTSIRETTAPTPATILVTLPAGAKLTIDGSPTTSTSGTRTFVSPPLALGSNYIYTLRAELNGQSQSQDIRVRPGEITQAQFNFPTSTVAGR